MMFLETSEPLTIKSILYALSYFWNTNNLGLLTTVYEGGRHWSAVEVAEFLPPICFSRANKTLGMFLFTLKFIYLRLSCKLRVWSLFWIWDWILKLASILFDKSCVIWAENIQDNFSDLFIGKRFDSELETWYDKCLIAICWCCKVQLSNYVVPGAFLCRWILPIFLVVGGEFSFLTGSRS